MTANVPGRQPAVRTGTAGNAKFRTLEASGMPRAQKAVSDPTLTFTQPEKEFQSQVIRYAELMGWQVFHDRATNAPRACKHCKRRLDIPRNDPGFPDLVMVRRPRVVFAELKSQRGLLTIAQRDWLTDLRASGQEAYLWRPSDWREIERVLGRFDRPVQDA